VTTVTTKRTKTIEGRGAVVYHEVRKGGTRIVVKRQEARSQQNCRQHNPKAFIIKTVKRRGGIKGTAPINRKLKEEKNEETEKGNRRK